MSKESNASGGGIGLLGALFLVLLTLKLLGKISVSWWVVTAPLWGGFLLSVTLLLVVFAVAVVVALLKK